MRMIVVWSSISLTACATERFGREQRVTAAEKTSLTCEQTDLEIAKVDGFLTDTEAQWEDTHGRRLLGFLGDFGIGNHMERKDAIESADTRRQQLLELRAVKHCPAAPAHRPAIDQRAARVYSRAPTAIPGAGPAHR